MFSTVVSAASLLLAASLAAAQTYTDCNPLTKTNCPPDPALGTTISIDFTKGANSFFKGSASAYDPNLGAVFTINTENDSPTLTSTKYIFFGRVDFEVRASTGIGVVTSCVLQSDDLDEIDWEWLGGDTTQVQTNYFSKGDTSTYDRGSYVSVGSPQATFHTYSIDWTASTLQWIIDGNVVRTLNYADAHGADAYPQTPMMIKLGTWDAGSSKNEPGTIEWAGGLTNFADAPFNGYIRTITITDYSNGVAGATEYTYGDQSGTYQSIKVTTGGSSGNVTQGETETTTSSSSTTKSTTTSKSSSSSSSSSSTTLSTSTVSSSNSTTTSAPPSSSPASTTSTMTTTSTTSAPSGAAVKPSSSLNTLVLGAVVFFGFMAL